jgi:GNAT superfamily N-acetyltransferase
VISWFVEWLQRLVKLGIDLAISLIMGLFRAPGTAAARAAYPIVVRRAEPTEVIDVRHRVLRPGRPREAAIFDGDDAPGTRHWVAVQHDRVVGVVTVIEAPMPDPPPEVMPRRQLRGMAVLPELQGEGVGHQLLLAAHGPEPMWCNARANVVAFYERHGWTAVGPEFDIPGVGPHRRMWFPGA